MENYCIFDSYTIAVGLGKWQFILPTTTTIKYYYESNCFVSMLLCSHICAARQVNSGLSPVGRIISNCEVELMAVRTKTVFLPIPKQRKAKHKINIGNRRRVEISHKSVRYNKCIWSGSQYNFPLFGFLWVFYVFVVVVGAPMLLLFHCRYKQHSRYPYSWQMECCNKFEAESSAWKHWLDTYILW